MSQEQTTLFNFNELDAQAARETLEEVYDALEERGYNPVNQIVGYLISGDPGYISSYKDARNKMQEVDRAKIVEILLQEFRKNK
ncbi:MAG: IreB family regulatory phosphoprotein [Bacilli bacterium]|nr:IreB family regulatory phosphoprotein [Bacilli bacterium]